jgi:hypothetical protein
MEKSNTLADETAKVETVELQVEELEPIVAPGLRMNHNETVVSDEEFQLVVAEEIRLEVEELEEVVVPARTGRNPATGG